MELRIPASALAVEGYDLAIIAIMAKFLGVQSRACHLAAEVAGLCCDNTSRIRRSGLRITQWGSSSRTSKRLQYRSGL